MNRVVPAGEMVAEIMDLGMTVVAGRYAIVGAGGLDLFELGASEGPAGFRISGLQKAGAPAAAVVVGTIGRHVDKVFFTDRRFQDEAQIFGHRVAQALAHQLAWVLAGELDFEILVPVGIDLQPALPDQIGIQLDDAFDLEIVGDIELFQSSPDCEEFVTSFGI
jgi:hypothetical protein